MPDHVRIESSIDRVIVYRDGAEVTRTAELPPGTHQRVRIGPLPLSLNDDSVRLSVRGATALVASEVHVELEVPPSDPDLPPARSEALIEAEVGVAQLRDQIDQLQSEAERIASIGVVQRPEGRAGRPPPESPADPRLALLELRRVRLEQLDARLAEGQRALRTAQRHLAAMRDRERRASSARNPEGHGLRKSALITLRGVADPGAVLELSYHVAAARWTPTYVLRLDRDTTAGALELKAAVCQRTGEDWSGVHLALSTAGLHGWAELPELRALRIGRKQPAAPQRGWRPPPSGAEALFADFDRTRPAAEPEAEPPAPAPVRRAHSPAPPPPSPPAPAPASESAGAAHPGSDLTVGAVGARAAALPVMVPARAAPKGGALSARAKSIAMPLSQAAASAPAATFGGPPGKGERNEGASPEAAAPSSLDYGRLVLPGPQQEGRGALRWRSRHDLYRDAVAVDARPLLVRALAEADDAARRCAEAPLPDGCFPVAASGHGHIYAAEQRLNAASDGAFHHLPILSGQDEARTHFVAVPRESRDVFRFVEMNNPFDGPLLDGPIDVYLGEAYLLSSALTEVPTGGKLRLGLGVESRLTVARNAHFQERSGGMLGGKLDLIHSVEVEIRNRLPFEAMLEVRERIPVLREDEDDISVTEGPVTPAWEAWEPEEDTALEGGRRWRVSLAPGASKRLEAGYTIRIASKHELVGGNRRER